MSPEDLTRAHRLLKNQGRAATTVEHIYKHSNGKWYSEAQKSIIVRAGLWKDYEYKLPPREERKDDVDPDDIIKNGTEYNTEYRRHRHMNGLYYTYREREILKAAGKWVKYEPEIIADRNLPGIPLELYPEVIQQSEREKHENQNVAREETHTVSLGQGRKYKILGKGRRVMTSRQAGKGAFFPESNDLPPAIRDFVHRIHNRNAGDYTGGYTLMPVTRPGKGQRGGDFKHNMILSIMQTKGMTYPEAKAHYERVNGVHKNQNFFEKFIDGAKTAIKVGKETVIPIVEQVIKNPDKMHDPAFVIGSLDKAANAGVNLGKGRRRKKGGVYTGPLSEKELEMRRKNEAYLKKRFGQDYIPSYITRV